MNFGFSGEMMFLFFLALILFGPKKLPEIGRQIGRIMNEFRRASNEFRSQIESEVNSLPRDTKPSFLQPLTPPPLGSLASRILNPPAPEQIKAADEAAEARAAEASAPGRAAVETQVAASPADPSPAPSKVAPDA